jgi:hypothetical protein
MVHVLADDWLYMDIDGEPGTYGREEVKRDFKGKIKNVKVAFIDCETRIIATVNNGTQKEALINAAFSNDYLIQEERLSALESQIIAAPKSKIEEIYKYFKPTPVKAVVPYPVCVRAFLKSKGLLPANKAVFFIDDLKTQAILTIVEDIRFTSPRRISMRDTSYLLSEIRRSIHNYQSHKDIEFVFISNNREWLTFFVEEGLASAEQIAHVNSFVSLEGLKTAQFGLNFILPEELVRQKKTAILFSRIKNVAAACLVIGIVIGALTAVKWKQQQALEQVREQEALQNKKMEELKEFNQHEFGRILREFKDLDYEYLYHEFVASIPDSYNIKSLNVLQKQAGWDISAVIYPSDGYYKDIALQGVFAKANLNNVVTNKKLGQRIDLSMNRLAPDLEQDALAEDSAVPVDFYYKDVSASLKGLSDFYDLKMDESVDGLLDGEAITTAAKSSQWPGIKQLDIKINFYDVQSLEDSLNIFKSLDAFTKKYPLRIASVTQNENSMAIVAQLYGT